jgi:hypothetical protein
MIDIRHLIRADAGRIRVLRLAVAGRHIYPLRYHARSGPGLCQRCGCTDRYACPGGCSWVRAAERVIKTIQYRNNPSDAAKLARWHAKLAKLKEGMV